MTIFGHLNIPSVFENFLDETVETIGGLVVAVVVSGKVGNALNSKERIMRVVVKQRNS